MFRRHLGRQDLERYFAIEPRVLGEIDFTHSAGTKLRADLVMTERCARGEWCGHCLCFEKSRRDGRGGDPKGDPGILAEISRVSPDFQPLWPHAKIHSKSDRLPHIKILSKACWSSPRG